MLEDVGQAAKEVGLLLHYGKTKILHNGRGQDVRRTEVQANAQTIEIVSSTDYLGTKLCLDQTRAMDLEVGHRIARAWSKFSAFRSELTNKKSNLFDRLRLFNAVVTPCALYGCGSWSLKKEGEQKIRVAQRRMLRAILGKGRRTLEHESASPAEQNTESEGGAEDEDDIAEDEGHLETWKDWLQHTTEEVRTAMEKLQIDDWVTIVRKSQWRWAGKVVQHAAERWTPRVLHWQPVEGLRQVGRPRRRWIDPIETFAQTWAGMPAANDAWIYLLAEKEEANAALQGYVDYCCAEAS